VSVVPLVEASDASRFGGKATQLGAALRAGLPVPAGYAVSVDGLAALVSGDGAARQAALAAFAGLGGAVAARSSAVGEDGADASFAGQHATVLNLTTEDALVRGLVTVFESAHSGGALAYRQKRGIAGDVRIAAVVQTLVDPVSAGVLFTRNPVTHAREIVVEASWGLGEIVVAGLVTPDHYRLTLDGRVLEARIGEKDIAIRRSTRGGTEERAVEPRLVAARCLDDAALRELVELARAAESHFGEGLDLEWARTESALFLLQSRPISTRPM
jgi:pyruvate,water dikinase